MNLNEITVKNYNGIGTLVEEREDGERKYIGEYYDGREGIDILKWSSLTKILTILADPDYL